MSPAVHSRSTTAVQHLLKTWAVLGLPLIQQFDNEAAFCGGHTHPRVIGRVVRTCLFCGIEPVFIPFYEAKRNYQVETFHSLWQAGFWSRHTFRNLAHVQTEAPLFQRWYHTRYRPPALSGRTPAQMRRGVPIHRLTTDLRHLLPDGRWPITAGRVHFLRKVNQAGHIALLNESWPVGRPWIGEYVRATLNTAEQALTIWHQADAESDWQLIKSRQFRLNETARPVRPEFRRNRARCRDYWPG